MKRPAIHWDSPLPRWLLVASLVALGLGRACAQGVGDILTRYSVRNWQTDDGLPQNPVWSIAQTPDGYLWVGTQQGLARFDGLRFVGLDESAPVELRHGWITALCTTRDGALWIACDGNGLFCLLDGRLSHRTEADGLASNQTRCLLESRDGTLWIGSEGGITRYAGGRFSNFTEKHGLGDNSVRAICEDRSGAIRIATRRGLSSLTKEGTIGTVNFGTNAAGNVLKSVCEDKQGKIWVVSNDGATSVGERGRTLFTMNEGLPDKLSTVVLADRGGRVWVGTYRGVACLFNDKVTCRPMNEAGFGDLVYTIFEDAEENIWVGGRDGLYRLRPARFTTYTTQEGLTLDNVMSVCEDRSGAICIATWGGGLNRMKDGHITVLGSTNGLTHDSLLALHEGSDGALWIGMDFDGGLNRLENGRNTFTRPEGMLNAPIRVIHEDRKATLWVGTSRGLNLIRDGKCAAYTTGRGLAGNNVMAICEDSRGTIWVGTDGGISRWTGNQFTNFTTHEGLSTNAVDAIYEDRDRTIWIGTKGGGLNRLKDGKFTAYTASQGLFNDEIYEVLEDEFGYLWMSCRSGIFRVLKQAFADLDAGHIKALACNVYGKVDGLASVQCNGVAKPAGWKGADGRFWFPTIRGVVAAETRIKNNERPPPVVIEDIIANKLLLSETSPIRAGRGAARSASAETRLTIAPGRGELEIHYTALSLQAPEKNRFKYRLDGVDPGWIDAGTRRAAYYNNIRPGNYKFQVIAGNNDGVWNETGAIVGFVFRPHFWETWWFKLTIPMCAALALAAWYRARVARLREIELLRIRIAADLHDDVGARLTKVAMVTEWVDRETGEADRNKGNIQNIARTTREVIQAMDEIVWTIDPKNDTLDNLANYIFQHAQEYFQHTGVKCRLDLPTRLPEYPLSTEQRHNLFMAVKEALNNVLKHAHATEARIGLAAADGRLTITIRDNGRGFRPGEQRPARNGLENMRQRLEQIRGRLILESEPGKGTSVEMHAPLD